MSFNTSLHLSSLLCLPVILLLSMNLLPLPAHAGGNETDRLALLKFKESIARDPNGVLKSWNASFHFCNWFGITCSHKHQRVTSLVLEGQNLFGSISPYVGNLSFLRIINLHNNSLHGELPQEVGRLFRLQYLILANNILRGEIPVNLTGCFKLRVINFRFNNVVGKIPAELGSLGKLQTLDLRTNNLSGEIPPSLGNLTCLAIFRLLENNFWGSIPEDMGGLTNCETFSVALNKLSGKIPPSLFNISSVKILSFGLNKFHGNLPDNIGNNLPNVKTLSISGNQFFGSIPSSISNATKLQFFDIILNNFVGQIPSTWGNLQNLRFLIIGYNNLGHNSSDDLIFLTNFSNLETLHLAHNNFGGILPNFINSSIRLSRIFLGRNQFIGSIPAALGSLINLNILGIHENHLTGAIPSPLVEMQNLQGLLLGGNRLSGQIPSFSGNFSQLLVLDLSFNDFEGNIPSSIQNCKHLYALDVSSNHLTGVIPQEVFGLSSLSMILNLSHNSFAGKLHAEVGKLTSINALDVSENYLSGEIPGTIGDCLSLELLYMQGNSFQGAIPSSLASLKGLRVLDLSRNNLTGEILQDLQNFKYLSYLNISFNHFEGEVPVGGVFSNASYMSFLGNDKLCNGILKLHFPRCTNRATKKSSRSHTFKLKIIIVCVFFSILLPLALLVLFCWRRKSAKKPSFVVEIVDNFAKISYKELYQATDNFCPFNIIGHGNFSSVCKGFLQGKEKPVAIKVLKLEQEGACKSIMAECKALRNIRHRNLVSIITFCSSLDYKGNDFKALVMEFMANGSLDTWLHPIINTDNQPRNLNLLERLNIAIDVASALQYLHNFCERTIVYCDLKPSNVLLDNDMIAHVSDFGLARFLPTTNDSFQSETSTIGLKGTIGYTLPEYNLGLAASKEGDVYSYGILILEMFSKRRPTDEIFKDGLSLHEFVKAALAQRRLSHIVDPTILSQEITALEKEDSQNEIEEQVVKNNQNLSQIGENLQKCLFSIFEIGVTCSAQSPNERMSMGDVTRKLHLIKNANFAAQKRRH